MQALIRKAINDVSEKYTGPEMSWIQDTNPVAFKHLGALMDRVDRAAISGNLSNFKQAIKSWEAQWLFWLNAYRVQHRWGNNQGI